MNVMFWVQYDGKKSFTIKAFEQYSGITTDGSGTAFRSTDGGGQSVINKYDFSFTCPVERVSDLVRYCFEKIPGSDISIYSHDD